MKTTQLSFSKGIITLVIIISLMPLTVFTTHFELVDIWIFLASYSIRMFAITAGYHRYFSHRAFKTNRIFQFILAWLGATSLQGGPLWWASHHRYHHQHSDNPNDHHSPLQRGFWHSHLLWFLYKENLKANMKLVKDFAQYPELRIIERYWYLSPILLVLILASLGGWNAVVWFS